MIIEVNGPSHYIKKIKMPENKITITPELNGRTAAKEKRLAQLGYKFVTINYLDVSKKENPEKVKELIKSKINV